MKTVEIAAAISSKMWTSSGKTPAVEVAPIGHPGRGRRLGKCSLALTEEEIRDLLAPGPSIVWERWLTPLYASTAKDSFWRAYEGGGSADRTDMARARHARHGVQ